MKKKFFLFLKELKEIFRATRIKRANFALLSILAAASFVNVLNVDIIALMIITILIYSIGGLHNAVVDNDYKIKKKYFHIIIALIFFISLILSLLNLKILVLILIVLILTFFYNTFSRKILYADLFTLSLTHIFIPFIGALWILNANLSQYFSYVIIPTLSFIFIVNVKNIVGFQEDKKRGYVTLMTQFDNGRTLMKISSLVGILIIIGFPLIFHLKFNIFSIIFILIVFIFLIKDIDFVDGKKSRRLARLIVPLILMEYIFENKAILIINILFLLSAYLFIKEGLGVIIDDIKDYNL